QELEYEGLTSPAMHQFASDVLSQGADVLTLNYDCVAERGMALASGPGHYNPSSKGPSDAWGAPADDELGDSHNAWKRPLAYGFKFDEVVLPRAGISTYVA